MVDSFDFSDTETNFKRVKTEQSTSSKTSPASSPRSYSNNHFRTNNYNHKYDHNRNGSRQNFISNYRNNYHNENRLDNNHRTTGYLGSKRPFKGNLTSFRPPTMYRKPVTSFSKNLKEESNRVLPKFNDFVPYKGRSFDAQGYRDPKYYDSSKKPGNRNISKTFYNNQQFTPSNFESGHENDEQVLSPANSIEKETKSETKSSPIISEIPNSPPIYLNNNKQDEDSSYFQIKTINSYKEFCRIKAKGSIEFATIYETISFLKAMTTNFRTGMKPIFLFFDKFERVFYGAAVVCLDEISEREQIDTNALESLIFRLNWIFLSEIEESNADFLYSQELKDSTAIDTHKGFQLLKLMEESETQLHDIKKLAPVALKLKSSRLNELEEYFKMTEDRKDVIIDKTIQIDINETESENETPETTEIIAAPEVTSQQEDDSSEYDFFADYE